MRARMQMAIQQRQKMSAKTAKKFGVKNFGSSGATSGLSSSLAFTPIQVRALSPVQQLGQSLG